MLDEYVVSCFGRRPPARWRASRGRRRINDAWLDSLAPTPGERAEARSFPGGWIYRIDARFDPDGRVPPEGIIGAFEVDPDGDLTGLFVPNDGYRPEADVPSIGIVPPRFDGRSG